MAFSCGKVAPVHQLQHLLLAAEGPIGDGAPQLDRANGRPQLQHFVLATEGVVVDDARSASFQCPSLVSGSAFGAFFGVGFFFDFFLASAPASVSASSWRRLLFVYVFVVVLQCVVLCWCVALPPPLLLWYLVSGGMSRTGMAVGQ